MLLSKISYTRLGYHLLLQAMGLFAIYHFFTTEQYALFIPALLVMFLSQFTIYAHYHMVVTHKAWKFNYKWIDHIFSIVGITQGMGSPIPWAIIHRLHHRHLDSEDDPHSPKHFGLFITQFHGWKTPDIVNARVPKKDLLRDFSHLTVYNNKAVIGLIGLLTWITVFLLFGMSGVLAVALGLAISNNNVGITNSWTHRLGDGVVDKPNLLIWALMLGSPEAYFHKEHHDAPYKYKHSESIFEWHARLVEFFSKIGVVTIHDNKVRS